MFGWSYFYLGCLMVRYIYIYYIYISFYSHMYLYIHIFMYIRLYIYSSILYRYIKHIKTLYFVPPTSSRWGIQDFNGGSQLN